MSCVVIRVRTFVNLTGCLLIVLYNVHETLCKLEVYQVKCFIFILKLWTGIHAVYVYFITLLLVNLSTVAWIFQHMSCTLPYNCTCIIVMCHDVLIDNDNPQKFSNVLFILYVIA